MSNPIKLGIAGSGHLANIIAGALRDGFLPEYTLAGVTGRTFESVQTFAKEYRCAACESLEELLALRPEYIIEAASPSCLRAIAEPALKNGANLVVLSIGAFADQTFYQRIAETARENTRKVHLASGAIGGFDVLRTATLMSAVTSGITTHKGPASLQNTPLFRQSLLEDNEKSEVFHGTAKEAIALLPTKVNVAVAASLATVGPEGASVSINSVPGMAGDDHRIEVRGEEVHAVVDIYSKTSDIAGWSVVALLQNLTSPIVF